MRRYAERAGLSQEIYLNTRQGAVRLDIRSTKGLYKALKKTKEDAR